MSIPSKDKILAAVGDGINPIDLLSRLNRDHESADVIEGLQRALERGTIYIDSQGFVIPAENA